MTYNPNDYFFKKAKSENYAARSVYKLEEMQKRFKVLKPGDCILDLGAAPGSWSQYASKISGRRGRVFGIDLQKIQLTLPNARFIVADMRDANLSDLIEQNGFDPHFDVVLSDMAPKTTGIRVTDQTRSMELCELAWHTGQKFLKPNGNFVCKLFHSESFEQLRAELKGHFKKVEALRPKSTRSDSKEIFLVGLGYIGLNLDSPNVSTVEIL